MVASQAVMEQGPIRDVAEVSASMEAEAESGEWEKVEQLAGKLRSAVMAVPEHERRDALLLAHRTIEHIQDVARAARETTAAKLSAIHRGRDATRAYATNE